jgi:hypothetical protein
MGIQKDSVRDQVRRTLTEQILAGHYKPGDRLVEIQIARELWLCAWLSVRPRCPNQMLKTAAVGRACVEPTHVDAHREPAIVRFRQTPL